MNRQFLITAMLFLLVISGYNQFVALPKARAAQKAAEEQLQQKVAQESSASVSLVSGSSVSVTKADASSSKPEQLFTLNLPQADVTFSSKGAGIKTYLFKDVVGEVDLTPYKGEGYFATFPQVDFTEFSRTKNSITFTGDIAAGFTVSKTYQFNEDGINKLNIVFDNRTSGDVTLSDWSFNFGPGLATVKSEMKENERESKAVYLVQEEGKKKPTLEKFTPKSQQPELPWMWAGIQNRYFLSVLIPQGWKSASFSVKEEKIGMQKRMGGFFGEAPLKGPRFTINVPNSVIPAKSKKEYNSDFYFGPKDYTKFQTMPYDLDRSIAFGFFGTLGKIARNILETLYGWTGNYGVAIILMTILLQTLLFKFTVMQLKSAAKMKKIQPDQKRIQEKYRDNPAEMNKAIMALYSKEGVNPLSGCLPLLVQLPIFLALYNALKTSWSLHGAKFVFWITDLSSKDPYYILPILMGAVMFFQQKGNLPAGADPAQTAMFKYMPLIFTLFFMNFPSGLVLYWLTNSLLTYAIQTFVNKKLVKVK